MDEATYVSVSNEAVILPCGPHTSLRINKPIACTGSRRRKGQPVKRKIIECDEESCNSNTTIGEPDAVANDVGHHAQKPEPNGKLMCAEEPKVSSPSSENKRFHIEPSTFIVDPSTIVIDSSNHVVSSTSTDKAEKQKSSENRLRRPAHQMAPEECPPDPIPNSGSTQRTTGGSTEPNTNKPMDQMEMIRRLLMLVGSSTGGSQTAALQLLLSSGNPALTLATTQLFNEQARTATLTSVPASCATDVAQGDPHTVFASLLGSSLRNDSPIPLEGMKTDVASTATNRTGTSSNRTASDAHAVLSSFVSKLLADSTNSEVRNGVTLSKSSSPSVTSSLLNASASLPNATAKFSFVNASESTNGMVCQPENTNDTTPENRGSIRANKESEPTKRLGKGQTESFLNPLSLTSRPVNQWSTSEMDAVLNSPLFRTLPRMSFRPPTKRKLFDDFSASTSSLQNSRPEIDDLESFAQHFKKQRIKLGYTQGDVGLALGRKYGTDFSQTTISRFEAMNLSFKNMCKLRPLLKEWLEGQEAAVANGVNMEELRTIEISKEKVEECVEELPVHVSNAEPIMKRRRKRTNLDLSQRKSLDNFFLANPRPGHEEMVRIANALDLERDVVRVWFCNRRQKLRRSEDLYPSIDTTKPKKLFAVNLSKDGSDGEVVVSEAAEVDSNPA